MRLFQVLWTIFIVVVAPIIAGEEGVVTPAQSLELRIAPLDYVYLNQNNRRIGISDVMLQNFAIINRSKQTLTLERLELCALEYGECVYLQVIPFARYEKRWASNKSYFEKPGVMQSQDTIFLFSKLLDKGVTLSTSRELAPGTAVMGGHRLFAFSNAHVPDAMRLTVYASDAEGLSYDVSIELEIRQYKQTNSFRFPLKGRWYVGSSSSVRSHHRSRAAHEFALDLLKIGQGGSSFSGAGSKHEDYYSFGEKVLAIADGVVVRAKNNVPETEMPLDGESRRDFAARVLDAMWNKDPTGRIAEGNLVILEHAGGEYSTYVHLKHGSVRVKKGERVKQGQVIAQLGISGDGFEPHLHFQVNDGPDPQYSRALPVNFTNVRPVPFASTIDMGQKRLFMAGEFIETQVQAITADGKRQKPAERDSSIKSRIETLFAGYNKTDSPGCVVGVIRDGRFVYQGNFGMANLEHGVPITPKSAFYIASTSKQFTAMAVFLLASEGKISLDADIRAYVPELPRYDHPVTIRHLLTHTSGVRDYLMLKQYAGIRDVNSFNDEQTLALLARQKSLNFTPGKRFAYSNSGYWLLALIVERQAGVSLGVYARRQIFQPLGMAATRYHEDARQIVKNRVQGYERRDDHGILVKDSATPNIGPGGVITTLDDLLLWDRNFYDPRVGGGEVLKQLLMPGRFNDGTMSREAPGLILDCYRGLPIVEHSGRGRGFASQILRFPEQKLTVIVLFNLHRGPADQRCFDVADIYLESEFSSRKSVAAADPADRVIDLPAEESQPLTGVYVVDSDVLEISLEGGALTATLNGTKTRILRPLGKNRFSVGGRAWQLAFQRGGKSKAESVTLEIEGNPELITFTVPQALSETNAEELTGRYYSEELDVVYHLSVEGGRLRIQLNDPSKYEVFSSPLITMDGDMFSDGNMTSIMFHRANDSEVTGFRLDDPRVTNIRFVKRH